MDMLTDRQQATFDFLARHLAQTGLPPTLGEVALFFGTRINAARKQLQILADKGWIELLPGKARGIRLLAAGDVDSGLPPFPPALLSLPLVGRVAAGAPILSEGHIEQRFALDPALFRPRPHFLLRVEGDSMVGAGILDGDLIAVHRTPEALSGQIVVARLEGEITVKRLQHSTAGLRLLSANPAYSPIEISQDISDFAIEGLYVGSIRR